MLTVGVPSSAPRCIIPVLTLTSSFARISRRATDARPSRPTNTCVSAPRDINFSEMLRARGSSCGEPVITNKRPGRFNRIASSIHRSSGHSLSQLRIPDGHG